MRTRHDAARFFRAPRAWCTVADDTVLVESDAVALTFTGPTAGWLQRAWSAMDGSHTLAEVAAIAVVPSEELSQALAVLAEERLVLDAGALAASAPELFFETYLDECEFWVAEIFAQPFWRAILNGSAPPAVVLGWGIEFYHYVCAANEHMAASVAYCRDDSTVRAWLAEHYVEEADHGEILLNGLAGSLDPDKVASAPPLASTRALVDYLVELAVSDTVAYAATFGVMQQGRAPKTRQLIDAFYDSLTALHPFGRALFDGFRRHALIDVELEHSKLVFERIWEHQGDFSSDQRRRVARAVRDMTEHFILFFEGISDYYGGDGALLPRRVFDFRTVV